MKKFLNLKIYQKTKSLKTWDNTKSIEVLNNITSKKINTTYNRGFMQLGVQSLI